MAARILTKGPRPFGKLHSESPTLTKLPPQGQSPGTPTRFLHVPPFRFAMPSLDPVCLFHCSVVPSSLYQPQNPGSSKWQEISSGISTQDSSRTWSWG